MNLRFTPTVFIDIYKCYVCFFQAKVGFLVVQQSMVFFPYLDMFYSCFLLIYHYAKKFVTLSS